MEWTWHYTLLMSLVVIFAIWAFVATGMIMFGVEDDLGKPENEDAGNPANDSKEK